MINDLITYITPGFRMQNLRLSDDILFDLWWIDVDGNIQIIIKSTDLYVYLCKSDRYPKEVHNIKIKPIPPIHLPPQHESMYDAPQAVAPTTLAPLIFAPATFAPQ
ncbi:unnamed protein product [Rotaria magnacalcarata]|uniref:Uncharacterized protein n=1 Tax=Rotaria magnacalcarata TaxID=392030 RepID=A0A816Z9K1_9BILA|nr:unnamed protein product [Rotaria magnacalcarata]